MTLADMTVGEPIRRVLILVHVEPHVGERPIERIADGGRATTSSPSRSRTTSR